MVNRGEAYAALYSPFTLTLDGITVISVLLHSTQLCTIQSTDEVTLFVMVKACLQLNIFLLFRLLEKYTVHIYEQALKCIQSSPNTSIVKSGPGFYQSDRPLESMAVLMSPIIIQPNIFLPSPLVRSSRIN